VASTHAGVHRGSKNSPENDFLFQKKNAPQLWSRAFYAYKSIVFFVSEKKIKW